MPKMEEKNYRCVQCGHIQKIVTNHYGSCFSLEKYNCCPKCPPHQKYPEFSGRTMWECLEKPPEMKRWQEGKSMNEFTAEVAKDVFSILAARAVLTGELDDYRNRGRLAKLACDCAEALGKEIKQRGTC